MLSLPETQHLQHTIGCLPPPSPAPAAFIKLCGMDGWVNERWAFLCGPLYVIPGLSCVVGSLSFKIQLRHYFSKEAPTDACLPTVGLEAVPVCVPRASLFTPVIQGIHCRSLVWG